VCLSLAPTHVCFGRTTCSTDLSAARWGLPPEVGNFLSEVVEPAKGPSWVWLNQLCSAELHPGPQRPPFHRCLPWTVCDVFLRWVASELGSFSFFCGPMDPRLVPRSSWIKPVAEPLELFRLKCAIDRRTIAISLTHFKRNNPLVCRVSARFNHGSVGSKQVYLARRRVYITE
jgi:hypothetical protein